MMLRMSRLQILDMKGFLSEYREGTRRSRIVSFQLFSLPSPFRVTDARKILRNNPVTTIRYFVI